MPRNQKFPQNLPLELHSIIASFVSTADVVRLCSTNRFFQFTKHILINDILKKMEKNLIKDITGGLSNFILTRDQTVFLQSRFIAPSQDSEFSTINNLPNNKAIRQIASNGDSALFLFGDDSLFGWGDNYYGQLGLGDGYCRRQLTQVTNLPVDKKIKQIFASSYHSFILFEDNTLLACGANQFCQLGISDGEHKHKFTLVPNLPKTKIRQVVIGDHFVYIVFDDDTLFSCGSNGYGQLGLGDGNTRNQFTQLTNLPKDKKIRQIVGTNHLFILFEDRTLWGVGSNRFGKLGVGDFEPRYQFTQIKNLPFDKKIRQIIAGSDHSFIIFEDNTLFACGLNQSGQLGFAKHNHYSDYFTHFTQVTNLPIDKKIKKLVTSSNHSFILFEDNTLFACGNDNNGHQIKYGPLFVPVKEFNHWADIYNHLTQDNLQNTNSMQWCKSYSP